MQQPSQYYQQPYYQIPPPPPPPKKRSIWPVFAIIAGVLIVSLVLFAVVMRVLQSIPASQNNNAATSVWQVTINSTTTSAGDESNTPNTGNIYLIIDFTAKNTDTYAQDMSHSFFVLQDPQGNTYDFAFLSVPNNPDGPVQAGQQLQGDLSYEVPKSLHSFILQFNGNSQIVQWTISAN